MGRPSTYTPELAVRICQYVAEGRLLRNVAKLPGMPSITTLHRWAVEIDDFRESLARAREQGTEANLEEAEDALRNAKPENIAVVRELAFHLRWKASKLKPRVYGERVQHSLDGAAVLRLEFGRRAALPDAINGEAVRLTSECAEQSVPVLPTNLPDKQEQA